MANQIPVKAIYTASNVTSLGEYISGDTISTTYTDAKVSSVGGVEGTVSNAQLASGITTSGILTTANVSEVTNLYYTNARVYANVESIGYASNSYVNTRLLTKANVADLTTSNVSEESNLYFTNARVYANVTALNYATTSHVASQIANLVNSAPSTLDTLNELASALNNDPSFATTTATLIGNSFNQANAAFAAANTKVSTVAGVTSTTISNSVIASGISQTGILTTANVSEVTNLYFSNARAILASIPAVSQINVTAPGFYYAMDSYSGNNPTVYVTAGETISFNLNVVGHPFYIRVSAGGSNYNTGLTHVDNNGTISIGSSAQGKTTGVLFWKIPYELGSNNYVYQCGFHPTSMVGDIVISTVLTTNISVQFGSLGVGTAPSNTAGEIRATNDITAFYSSDKKYKENVQPIQNALEIIKNIGGKTFDWTDEYIKSHGGEDGYFVRKNDYGVIAQDVEKIFPLAVRKREDGSLAVDYSRLSALAFAAIIELAEEINKLKNK